MTTLRAMPSSMFVRIRSEFLEMPGLRFTVEQVQRLCGVEGIACQTILDELVETNVLSRNAMGVYALHRA
jgi:hypothetical protein